MPIKFGEGQIVFGALLGVLSTGTVSLVSIHNKSATKVLGHFPAALALEQSQPFSVQPSAALRLHDLLLCNVNRMLTDAVRLSRIQQDGSGYSRMLSDAIRCW